MSETAQTIKPIQLDNGQCESYFRALFECSAIGLIVTDAQNLIVHSNPAFCEILKYQPQRLLGVNYFDLIINADHPRGRDDGFTQLQNYRCVDGSSVACLASTTSLRDSDGKCIGGITLVQEISYQIQDDLKQQRRELETLLDTLPMPVFFKDKALRYQRANRTACDFLGLGLEQIVGRDNVDLFPSALAQQIRSEDDQAMHKQSLLITADTLLADAHGELHYFSTYKSPVIDDEGQIAGLLDLMLDVTERKLAESERLTSIQGQRDALVQEVHHRIKNHLQGVVGLLQRAISGTPLLAEPLRVVLAQVESIAGIHGLQSRLGNQCLKFGQVAAMIAELTPNSVVVSGNGLDAELPHQEAVPFALTLNELVSNAFKHRQNDTPARPVNLDIQLIEQSLQIQVRTGPAKLPPEFDFAAGIGLGTGLRLLRALLPSQGAYLHYYQDQDEVIAELQLIPPLVFSAPSN